MTNTGNNPYVTDRKSNIGMLRRILIENPSKKTHKQLKANFAIRTGLTLKKVNEYYQMLVDEGTVQPEAEV